MNNIDATRGLNYQHLYYFWVIAQEGGISHAGARLRLTHSTLSVQLRALESHLGEALFERRGRRLVLTPFGAEVQAQAGEIFRLGAELRELAAGRGAGRAVPLRVGVPAALPRTLVARLLAPAMRVTQGPLVLRQDRTEALLHELSAHRLDMIVSESLPPPGAPVRLHAHELGSSEVVLYGARELARRYRAGFPAGLAGAPVLMPGPGTSLRRALDRWLVERDLQVSVVAEIDDAALLRTYGGLGHGLFPVRRALRSEVEEAYGAQRVGHLAGVSERYYAVSLERRVTMPAVAALIASARQRLIAPLDPAPGRGGKKSARSRAARAGTRGRP